MKRKAMELNQQEEQKNGYNHGQTWLRGEMIGKGSFGSVYLACLKKPKSRFRYCPFPSVMAVKSAEFSLSGSIQKEKQVLTNLNGCFYLIKCFGDEITVSENGGMVYNLLLEYASEGTLADYIRKSGSCGLPESEVKRYVRCILQGLSHIHDCGYVHCDLKPENILLVPVVSTSSSSVPRFVAKIGDFGLAKRVKDGKKRILDPYLRGTAMYLAPEVVVDNVQDQASDIWALGCIVLEMLTGKPPWDRKPQSTTKELLYKIGYGHELPVIPNTISKECKEFLKRCLVRKPMFRFTVEMLLDHPFVAVDNDEEIIEEIEDFSDCDTDHDLSSSYFSDDYSFDSAEGFSFYSLSEEESIEKGKLAIQTDTIITTQSSLTA